jgi:hypothetical protein
MAVPVQGLGVSINTARLGGVPRRTAPVTGSDEAVNPANPSAQATTQGPRQQAGSPEYAPTGFYGYQTQKSLTDAAQQAATTLQDASGGIAQASARLNTSFTQGVDGDDTVGEIEAGDEIDPADAMLEMLSEKARFQAGVAVLKTTDRMIGTLLDVVA